MGLEKAGIGERKAVPSDASSPTPRLALSSSGRGAGGGLAAYGEVHHSLA